MWKLSPEEQEADRRYRLRVRLWQVGVVIAVVVPAVLVWWLLRPPAYVFGSGLIAWGAAVLAVHVRYAPVSPSRGRDPREVAADEFFKDG
ncbi:MAG: hypothetical protein JSR45_15260 [Proteobacteria bacterium]|nr:hypothetical protein [Pseudomonadota bacterium]